MKRVGLYLRLSEDRDGTQTATERQRMDCARFAAMRGWELADVFEDVDLSAYKKNVKRPEFERMLQAVREKRIDGVLAWKMDRITRRQRDLVRLDEACEDAGGFIATMVENIDTTQPTGRFVAELLVAQARMESENQSIRLKRKAEEMASQGRPQTGGWRMFGYTRDRSAVVAPEAELIREAARRVLAGESIRGICTEWKARGVVTTVGKPWQQQPLRRVLMNAALCGEREHNGVRTRGTWPPILTSDDTRRLRALLSDPRRLTRVAARRYLLTRFLRCGRCGGTMVPRPRGDKVRRYVCATQPGNNNCGGVSRLAEPVEQVVKESVCIALDGVDLRGYVEQPSDQNADVLVAIREDEQALEQLSRDHYVDKLIGRSEFIAAREALDARLTENRARLARSTGRGVLTDVVGAGDQVRSQWEAKGLDWQRAVIGAVVDHIKILPAIRGDNRFHPELVQVVWRF